MTIDGRSISELVENRAAFSIPQWCDRNGVGASFYFKLQKIGAGPRVMRIGRRTLISREADEEWCRELEAASAPKLAESV